MDIKVSSKTSDFSGKQCIITVGMFDGLHRGHQYFLKSFIRLADDLNLEPVLIGLYPHPRKFLHKLNFKCLTSVDEKSERLRDIGLKNYLLLESNSELLSKTATEFLQFLISGSLDIKAVAMGFNNRFGRPVEGEPDLEEQVKSQGLSFYRIAPYGEKVSSTLIREALAQGRVEYASQMLGYTYQIKGDVVPGNRIGRKIGFPTANIRVNAADKLIPAVGVYAVGLVHDGREFPAMMNIGYRPTIEEEIKDLFLEVHVPGEELNLYDQQLEIRFYTKVRDEKRFNSLEELRQQLLNDKDFIIQYFNRNFANSKK